MSRPGPGTVECSASSSTNSARTRCTRLEHDEAARQVPGGDRTRPRRGARVPEPRRRAVSAGQRRRLPPRRGNGSSRWRPSASTSPSIGWPRSTRSSAHPGRFADLCRRLIVSTNQDWRARHALAGHLTSGGPTRRTLSRTAPRGADDQPARDHAAPGGVEHPLGHAPARGLGGAATSRSRATPSSTRTRTSACGAAIGAPNCCGNVRTATSGTASSRIGSRRRGTRTPATASWSPTDADVLRDRPDRRDRHRQELRPGTLRLRGRPHHRRRRPGA